MGRLLLLLSLPAAAVPLLAVAPAAAQQRPAVAAPGAQSGHPAEDYRQAAELFRAGRHEEATYLFYRGQLRFRVNLTARPGLAPDGDPALFASLSEVVGRPINEWAFGDVPALAATLDRVLAWQAGNDDPFTLKAEFSAAHAQVRAGLEGLKVQVLRERESIRAQRRANGLPNRS